MAMAHKHSKAQSKKPFVATRLKMTPANLKKQVRDKRIFEMFVGGKSKADIAEHYHIAEQTVANIISDRLNRYKNRVEDLVEDARARELAMLDQLQETNFDLAKAGSKDHAQVVLSIHKSRKELLGLDAPAKVHVQQETVTRVYQGVDEKDI